MATYGWGTQHAVADWLFAEAYRFDFYQAVALLERLYPERVPVGEGEDRARKSYASRPRLPWPFRRAMWRM